MNFHVNTQDQICTLITNKNLWVEVQFVDE
jgi:hypothetical protein